MLLGAPLVSLLALPLLALGASTHGAAHSSRHQQIAKRHTGDVQLHKRFSNARWTFYDVGLGACGKWNVQSDFIVALNSAQFGGGYPGPNCFKSITMTYNGKTTQATIMDECPGCPYGGLDLSRGLFRFFAAESVGVIQGEWHFNDGSGGGGSPPPPPPPPPKPQPTTSKWVPPLPPKPTPKPQPTTTWKEPEPETTTSTPKPKPKPTTTSSTSTSAHISTSSSAPPKSSSTPAPAPTLVDQTANLQRMDNVLLGLGGIVLAGAQV
ncbi:hypothetical protein LshimejAT787_0209190 [Lyophyllum shimeji]|uniref:Uncharacterized protein n=1 Tax=Lyophyllum shimeji TaxID=47721 RepID=A0A9P3PH48_LYOSH|nr:hypothetical protein LshimejAT787_0209190 [Lyophyllum shimeji]